MKHLYRAGICRLLRNRIFWLELAAVISMAVLLCLCNIRPDSLEPQYLDYPFFAMTAYNPLFYAAGVSLFLGCEYSYGTIRNKLSAGHTRWAVYSAQMGIAVLSTLLVILAQYAVVAILGTALYDGFQASPALAAQAILFCLLSGCSITCICGAIALNCQSRSISVALSMLVFLVLQFWYPLSRGKVEENTAKLREKREQV